MKKSYIYSLVALFCCVASINSQNIFREISVGNNVSKTSDALKKFKEFKFDKSNFLNITSNTKSRKSQQKSEIVISLPDENGNFEDFEIFESSLFSRELSIKYPMIKSYVGRNKKRTSTVRFSYSPSQGFNAAISNNKKATILIKPSNLKNDTYISFLRSDIDSDSEFECETIEKIKKKSSKKAFKSNNDDGYLRKYRLAVATTGEFSNFFLDGSEVDDTERKEKVLAAINTSLTRINGIFERDFSITLELVASNDEIIFLDASTDPFTEFFNSELQGTLDNIIQDENYDVGHLFAHQNSIYGNAGCIACVCTSGSKGSAFTVHRDPSSDHFNMIASHELGHQFGGYHVQSSSNCRSSAGLQEVEPGSGSTIMGYAGICEPNVQDNPDDYFNYVDIRDVIQWTRNDSSCAELIATGNQDPRVSAGQDYIIPRSTAFILEGTSTDANEDDILTYCWEQNDPEDPFSASYPNSQRVYGPLYRSKLPVNEPVRYMPQLSDVLSGNLTPTWEVTPSVSRTLDFVLTARDNAIFGPKTDSDEMTLTVDDRFGPFVITSQNSSVVWNVGDTKTITWDVANTTNAPINASNVDVFLSVDGGYTYPYTLVESTSNDGSVDIIVPDIEASTNEARFMVRASNNIFFAVNQADFQIQKSDFVMSFPDNSKDVCNANSITYNFTYNTYLGFNEETTFSVEGIPTSANVTFTPSSALEDGTEVQLEIQNTEDFSIGENQFIVVGTSSSYTKQAILKLNSFESNIDKPILSFPNNNDDNLETEVVFNWENDVNAETYVIEIATDNTFSNIIDTKSITDSQYSSLNLNYSTTYFWRVKGINSCEESDFSDIYTFTTLCLAPNNLNVTNVGINSAEITWVENGNASRWEIEIIPYGENPTGIGETVDATNYSISGLNSSTKYDVYVKSSCNDINTSSSWVGPFTFSTLTDFCNGESFVDSGGIDGNYENDAYDVTVISPNDADIVEVNFLSFDIEWGSDILYVFDGKDFDAPFIGSFTGDTLPPTIRSSFGNSLAFYFLSNGSVTRSGWEAEVSCITISCPAPESVIATNMEANSVDLNWVTNGDETSWEIEYVEQGKEQGTKVEANQHPFTLEGLQPSTSYSIRVRAICGDAPGTDDSFWTTPILIETPCGNFNTPYYYDVEQIYYSGNIEDCWTTSSTNSGYFWNVTNDGFYDSNPNTGPSQARSGDYYFGTLSYYNTIGDETQLVSPDIDISTLNEPVLDFYTFMYGENIGSLYVDVFSNDVWVENVFVLEGQQQTFAEDYWREDIVDLKDFGNTIKIRFRAVSGGFLSEINIDDISIIEKPTCITPSVLVAANIQANSVELNWQANGDETKWQIEYGETGFTIGEGIRKDAIINPYLLSDLTPVTNYDIYVRAICGDNPEEDDSNWLGPISIETPCGVFNAPYIFDVEDLTSGQIEQCWSLDSSNTYNYYWTPFSSRNYENNTGPFKANSGNLYLATYPFNYSNIGDVTELISPEINIGSLSDPVLDFYTFMNGETMGSLHIDIFNKGAWTEDVLVIEGRQQENSRDLWEEQIVDLSSFEEVIQVKFRAISGGGYNSSEIDIDDISIIERPTCINPSNFEASNVTYESVELSWTANNGESSWLIEYGQQGFTNNSSAGTKVTTTSNPYVLTGLNSETNYDIYIKAVCGSEEDEDDSKWIGPISIETPCGIFTAPFFYDVEQQYNGTIEDCWVSTSVENSNYLWYALSSRNFENTTGPYKAKSGYRYFGTNTYSSSNVGDSSELISPLIDISTLEDPVLDFHTFMFGENIGSLHIDILNNGVWTEDVFVINGQQQESSRDLWQQQLVDLNNFEGIISIKFRAVSGGGYNSTEISLDDISVAERPSCINPSDFAATNVTYESVELNWTTGNNETEWQIEYGYQGFPNGSGNVVTASTNPFVLTELNSETIYDIYVRASCGADGGEDNSNWVGPITIETPCGIFNAPFFYDVEEHYNGNIDDCWESDIAQNSSYYWQSFYGLDYNDSTGPHQPKSGNRYFGIYPYLNSNLGDVAELKTPTVNINTLTHPALSFFSFMHGPNIGSLHIDVLNDGVWTEDVHVINGVQQTDARDPWHEQIIDLSSFSGNIQVKFRAVSGGGYNSSEIDIDDISFQEMPTCITPNNLNVSKISHNTAELNWSANGDESLWQLEYGEPGFSLGNGTQVLASSNPFTLSDLNSQTEYDIYLRAICGVNPDEDDSSWIGPVSIKTVANYCNGDHFYDSGGANGSYSNGENEVTVIYPINGDYVEVEFLSFSTESCCDWLRVYDGPDVNSPLLGSFRGSTLPGKFVSTHSSGALTFHFTSDGSVVGSGWDAVVNCVSLSCPVPSNVSISNITDTEVTIDWNLGSNEEKWQIEYGAPNFSIGNGQRVDVDSNPYVLTDLDVVTSYDFYLRAICGETVNEDDSEWTGPFSFETICATVKAPFYEDFVSFSIPDCWFDEHGSESWKFNTNADFDAANAGDNSPNGNTNYAWVDGSYPNGNAQVSRLMTNWIDISDLTNPALEFSLYSVNSYDNTYNTFSVIVYGDNDNEEILHNSQSSTGGWQINTIDLSDLNLSNKVRFEFVVHENSSGNSYQNDILIDEIKVDERAVLSTTSNSLTNFQYFPNPVTNKLNLVSDDKISSIIIYNTLGQEIYNEKMNDLYKVELEFKSYPQGTYLIKAFSKDKIQAFRVFKE